MKKLLLFGALVFGASATSYAQAPIANGDFETWTGSVLQRRPQGWLTTDDVLAAAGFPIPIGNVTRSTSPHGGSYAAQVATVNNSFIGDIPGFLILGTAINPSSDFPGGIPYTGRPARLQFYYKLTGAAAATDSALVGVALTRTVGGITTTVADTVVLFTALAPAYTLASVPLNYRAGGQPDSLRLFISSGGGSSPTAGTTLTIDDIALVGTAATTRDAQADAALSVYPTHSAEGRFTLNASTHPALLSSPLTVTDATGRVVLRQGATATSGTRPVELPRNTATGLYLLRLDTPSGPLTRKLVVE